MHIGIIGYPLSGKGTVAEVLMRILGAIRSKEEPREGESAKRKIPLTLVAADHLAAVPYLAAGSKAKIVRVRSITAALEEIKAAAGGVVVLETMTGIHSLAAHSWLSQHTEKRQKLGYRAPDTLPVNGWVDVNRAIQNLLTEADRHDVDLIQVHREGPPIVYGEDGNYQEKEGVKSRGMGEANLGDTMTFHLSGGVRSKRPSGDRRLWVLADASGFLNGQSIDLPAIRGKKERVDLHGRLERYLSEALKKCRALHRLDVDAWLDGEEEMYEDEWATASSSAEAPEHRRQINVIQSMFEYAGLDGSARSIAGKRERTLEEVWGRGRTTVKSLEDLPLAAIVEGLPVLSQKLHVFRPAPGESEKGRS
jgi:hypothetical protein